MAVLDEKDYLMRLIKEVAGLSFPLPSAKNSFPSSWNGRTNTRCPERISMIF